VNFASDGRLEAIAYYGAADHVVGAARLKVTIP
jgi:hypothetical protein